MEPDASADEIRKAHRRLVHVLHPDRHHEANEAERALADRRMREINEAWNTLREPSRRKNYDSTLGLGNLSSNGAGGSRNTSTTRPTSPGRREPTTQRPASRQSPGSWTGPGRSAEAGRGAYWHGKEPKAPSQGPGRADPARGSERDDDDVGPEVTPVTAFLLGKGPIIVIVAVVVGLFVVTAYVGGGGGDAPEAQPPPLDACARVYDGSDGILIPCSMPNDGKIEAQVGAPLDCPEEASRYVSVGSDFYCIRSSERPSGGG